MLCTNGADDSQSNSPMGARKVRFNPVIRVCLVPCRADFRGDFYLLFWEREDYQAFKEDAVRELRAHWTQHHTSVKEAIFDMYQPSPDGVDHVMTELAPPPLPPRRILAHVDSMGVMSNFAKSSGAARSSGSGDTAAGRISSIGTGTGTSTNSTAKSSNSNSKNASVSTAVACPTSQGDAHAPIGQTYVQPLLDDAPAEDAPSAYSHSEHGHSHERYGSEAETTFGDFVVEEEDCAAEICGGGGGGDGLTGRLTSGDICPVTPLRRDHLSLSKREVEETVLVDASALFTPGMSSAPYRSHLAESAVGAPPQPSRTSPTAGGAGDRGAESVSMSANTHSSAVKEGNSTGGSVRLILCEESPSSCASSFEAPILIC
jgi:hypothetical protein